MRRRHVSKSDRRKLRWIIEHESSWRNLATNGPCKGLGQLNTKQPKRKWASPYWNVNRVITYCTDGKHYDSISEAYRHKLRTGWY